MITEVALGPARTSAEIAADRYAANAFWARLSETGYIQQRDNKRMIDRERHDWKLTWIVWEAREWVARNNDPVARATKHAALLEREPLLRPRNDAALKPYLNAATRKTLPAPRATRQPVPARARHAQTATYFFQRRLPRLHDATSAVEVANLQRVLAEKHHSFEQWQIVHREYGGVRDHGVQIFDGHLRPVKKTLHRYRRGTISPVGVSAERALEVATKALAARGGRW